MTTERYDPATYVHFLFWRLRCLEAGFMEFQKLFEDVAARVKWQFVRIKPHGRLGDKKADGLYFVGGTVFQVYAPDEMKLAATLKKIKEDLAGAVKHWGKDLKEWVFVYNDRRGLAPDIPQLLKAQQKKYQKISIQPLSADDLWKVVRSLPVADRMEILGPPPGYESLFPLSMALPAEVQRRLRRGRFVVIQDILSPINVHDALKALGQARPFGPPLFVRALTEAPWDFLAAQQRTLVSEAIGRSREHLPRFAVFSLAPVPLAIHLGYLLSDRVEVSPFQYDRERKTWCWDTTVTAPDIKFSVKGIPRSPIADSGDVLLRVSLSARVAPKETLAVVGRLAAEIDLGVREPDVMWLNHPDQLEAFGKAFRGVLKTIRNTVPNCRRLHLFFAGPTGAAFTAGQAINPRMNPPVVLYEYHRQKTPRYEAALTLR